MPKFLISDCDYTLVDFNHKGGIDALRNHSHYSPLAKHFDDYFQNILAGTRLAESDNFLKLKSDLTTLSKTIVQDGDKLHDAVWSRELWAYHFFTQTSQTDKVQHSLEAANIYWRGVGESSAIYEDTSLFLDRLRQNKFQVILVSSSDGRLTLNKENHSFTYNPADSKKLKTERYQLCGLDKLVDLENELYIGDPIAKPHKIFWEETLQELAIDLSADNNHIVVIGDSYDTDLKGAAWFKSQSILLDRNKKHSGTKNLPDADHVAHNLQNALEFIL